MRTVVLFIILLVVVSCACPRSDWTRADSMREASYLALHVLDWGQTLDIADHPEKFYERNPILGEHPSRGEVNRYFAAGMVLHPVVSYLLPRPYREWWQYSTIGLEMVVVGNNARIGIGMGF